MYVPIIIDPCSFYDYRYLWEYLMYEYHCYKNNWPLIAEESYKYYKEKRPISNVYEAEFCQLHQYEVLNEYESAKVRRYFISNSVFKDLEEKCGSKLGVKLFLLKNRYKPLEKEIKRVLFQIKKDTGEQIEGILNWNAHFFSVRYVAEKMRIPVITNEFCLRFPEYYSLGYFCASEIYESTEIQKMFNCFQSTKSAITFPLLKREEILALILEKSRLKMLHVAKKESPQYEIGIAGCHPIIPTFFVKSTYTDLELIEDVRGQYSENDILFRKHPGDEPFQADYTLKNKDTSHYASEFILKCKRITAIGSNTILEALLWGKAVYTNNVSPFSIFCERDLMHKEESCIDDEILNFIIFGYLIPYNKMFDEEYMKWRIHERNLAKIIEHNITYCFSERKIPKEVLKMKKHRYEQILKYREEKENE